MMLLKCCAQYVSICRKLGNGHRTGKGQFWFQPQRRAVPKNVQTTIQLCSFFMLVGYAQNPSIQASTVQDLKTSRCTRRISKSQRNQRSNCQHLLDHRESKGFPEKHLLLHLLHWRLWLCGSQKKTVKILKEMGITDHLTCLLRNLHVGQEATVRTLRGTTDWFKIRKGVWQGWILSPCLTYVQNTSGEMLGWLNHKLESWLPGKISTISEVKMIPL